METILAFLAVVVSASLVITRLGPFLSLILASIAFGLLSGMGGEMLEYISSGLSRIFSALALVVFCGALMAEYLRRTEGMDRIVFDLRRLTGKIQIVSGAAGYLLSLPAMCSITAYMILEPVVKGLAEKAGSDANRYLFMTAACSIISFNLIYPSPVMITLASGLSAEPSDLLRHSIPISLILFAFCYLLMRHMFPGVEVQGVQNLPPRMKSTRAWIPLLVPLGMMLLGSFYLPAAVLGRPDMALLMGAIICLWLERGMAREMVHAASRRSGVILLDLCGAGAFGYVIAESGLAGEIYQMGQFLPSLLLPFFISALLQLAIGSRVVTAAVSCQILAGYPLPPVTLALLIASGAFILPYVTDPYFWLIKRSTKASMMQMVRGYTLPLSLLGLASFLLAGLSSLVWPQI